MNNRISINDELQTFAPGLVSAPVVMPYPLPPSYFEQFPVGMLDIVYKGPDDAVFSRDMLYQVPSGYFEELASVILTSVKGASASTELENDLFGSGTKQMPYTVPEGYFEGFPTAVLTNVSGSTPFLHKEYIFQPPLSKEMPYTIPEGYFEQFSASVSERIKSAERSTIPQGYFESLPALLLSKVQGLDVTNELDEVAPLLNTINKKPVQQVPDGYFEKLEPPVKKIDISEKQTPVILIRKKTNWQGYAVAACVIFLLGLSAFFLFNIKTANTSNYMAVNPVELAKVNVDKQLASLDEATIEKYLQDNGTPTTNNTISTDELNELNEGDIDNMLRNFSDQQLKKHIDETPELPSAINPKKPS